MRIVAWTVCFTALFKWAQEPVGVVNIGPNVRYLTQKPGFWHPQKYLGSHEASGSADDRRELEESGKVSR